MCGCVRGWRRSCGLNVPAFPAGHICGCNRTNCVPHSGPGVWAWGSRVAVGLWVILCVLCGTCCGVEALSLSVYRGDALGSCVGSLVYGFYSRVTSTPPVNIAGAVPVGFYRCMPNRKFRKLLSTEIVLSMVSRDDLWPLSTCSRRVRCLAPRARAIRWGGPRQL